MRIEDKPATRREEVNDTYRQLERLAARLGFKAQGTAPLIWLDAAGQARYWFWAKASTVFGTLLHQSASTPERSFLVIPGGRANLAAYKLRRDARLSQAIGQGWRFLKFRHLRWLLERYADEAVYPPSAELLEEQFNADPLTYDEPQLRLF